jgi:hypothetical protein
VFHAMHVDAGNPLMHRFHNRPPSAKLSVREASSGLGRMPAPLARCGPIYRACCKLRLRDNLGYGLAQMGPVSYRSVPAKLRTTSHSKSPALALYPNLAASTFHHWGRQLAVMMVRLA